jgi:glycosyltransferase involved in cell wall biosynthesis
MNQLISVVIPTYNWSNVLKLAIKSVLWQSYQNFEIIVVGDACTDDSEEVVKSFNDSRIKWFNLEQNSGSHKNMDI